MPPGAERQLDRRERWNSSLAPVDSAASEGVGQNVSPNDIYSNLKKEGRSNRTIQKYHFDYCIFSDFACDLSGVEKNPFRQIQVRKYFQSESPSRDINFLVPEEVSRLIEQLRKNRPDLVWRFVQFLAYTGLRRSEAYALKWTDIDFEAGFVSVRLSKTKRSRIIPLETPAIEAIRDLDSGHEYVFTKSDGTRFHIDSFIRPVQEAAREAGIRKRIDIHTLRHSYGSNKIRSGWGIRKVSQILGHSDIQLTASYYSHLLDGDLKIRDEFLVHDKRTGLSEATRVLINALLDEKEPSGVKPEISEVIAEEVLRRIQLVRETKMNEKQDSIDSPASLYRRPFVADTLQISETESSTNQPKPAKPNFTLISRDCESKMEPMIRIERTTYALRKRCSTN